MNPMTVRTRLFHGFLGLLLSCLWIWFWCFAFAMLFFIVDDPYVWARKQGFHIPFWGATVTSLCSVVIGATVCPIIYSNAERHKSHPAVFSSLIGAFVGSIIGIGLGGSLGHVMFSLLKYTYPDDTWWIFPPCVVLSGVVGGGLAGVVLNWKFPNRSPK
jgi:uncharacterized PurR-regulated membrane protein YhhQ (DUF165 family)